MRDGVGGPDVAGVARDGVAAGHLRGAIVAGLLEGEGLQPPHIAVAGHARVPGVEWPRDRPQHGRRVAQRSEERRVGKEGVSRGRSGWLPIHEKKKRKRNTHKNRSKKLKLK